MGYVNVSSVSGGGDVWSVASLPLSGTTIRLTGYYPGSTLGGGTLIYSASTAKSLHDGFSIFSPTVPWDGTEFGISAYKARAGETSPGGSGVWVRVFDGPLTPYHAGATGLGIGHDDRHAFQSIATNVAGKAKVRVSVDPGDYYLSNSVDFDCEEIEFNIEFGAHIFTTAASTSGEAVGFIGHIGGGTSTAPVRGSVKITGQGKITGWLGGSNENAIGIVRYADVLVDGLTVAGGNKGITAQYGIARARIRNVVVTSAGNRGISVEDQGAATDVEVSDCRVVSAGAEAVLVAGARLVVRDVTCDAAFVAGGSPITGAVHLGTTGTLQSAEATGVRVISAGVGRGIVISGASAAAGVGYADDVLVGASTGNAVEMYNLTAAEVGKVYGPYSAADAVATGSTPYIIRLGQPARNLISGESPFDRLQISSTAVGVSSGVMRLTYFVAEKTETVRYIRMPVGTTGAAASPSLCRAGVYSVALDGTLTLVGSIANDTELFAAANGSYTRNLSTAFRKVRGNRYAIGILIVTSAATPTFCGLTTWGSNVTEVAIAPRLCGLVTGLSDLPASIAQGSIFDATAMLYTVLTP